MVSFLFPSLTIMYVIYFFLLISLRVDDWDLPPAQRHLSWQRWHHSDCCPWKHSRMAWSALRLQTPLWKTCKTELGLSQTHIRHLYTAYVSTKILYAQPTNRKSSHTPTTPTKKPLQLKSKTTLQPSDTHPPHSSSSQMARQSRNQGSNEPELRLLDTTKMKKYSPSRWG